MINCRWISILLLCSLGFTAPATNTARLSGYLRDGITGEPIMYANIVLEGTYLGAASDVHGHYVILNIPPGHYTLKAMMMGYETLEQSIEFQPGDDKRLDMEIFTQALTGETVEVTAERTRFEEKVEISRLNLSVREIVNTPAMVEADLFRTLQMTPSVNAKNDFSSALIVRGGGSDENLILLDGIEVYNPYHLGGVFSTFNADALADAEFLAGGFPAKFGNRNSAVLDITSREGNSKKHLLFADDTLGEWIDLAGAKVEVSLLSSKALLEGPHKMGAWMVTARRTYYDQIANLYFLLKDGSKPPGGYYFWDMHWKTYFDFDPRNRLTLAGYYGRDFLAFNYDDDENGFDIDMDWGNYTTSAQWRFVPSSKFHSTFSLAHTVYDWDFNFGLAIFDSTEGTTTVDLIEEIDLRDWTVKEKLDWFATPAHTLTAGCEYKVLDMGIFQEMSRITFLDRSQNPYIFSLYFQDKWKIGSRLNFQPGLRISKYELHGDPYWEPRLGFKYLLTENLALKGSWGIYKQYMFTNTSDEEIIDFVEFWLPVPKEFEAQSCQHYIVGMEQRFAHGFYGSLEAYYKPYDNMLEVNPNNNPVYNDDDFVVGTGEAWGIELLIKKTRGDFTGWLGYSYSHTRKRIDFNSDGKLSKEEGEIYYTNNDIPHSLNLVLNYQLNDKHSFGLTTVYNTGKPFTVTEGLIYAGTNYTSLNFPYSGLQDIPGIKNGARYPAYFRMDISYMRGIHPFGWNGKFKFQIINVTNHFNVLIAQTLANTNPTKVQAFSMFPIIPSFGVEFEF